MQEYDDLPSDLGTPELIAKRVTEVHMTQENKRRRRVLNQVPLDHYRYLHTLGRGGINYRQWEAGDKLFKTFCRTSLIRSPSPMAEVHLPPSLDRTSNSQYEALESYMKALGHLGRHRPGTVIVINVCCYGYELKDLQRLVPYYLTSNQLMTRMKESLDDLADYYGLPFYPER